MSERAAPSPPPDFPWLTTRQLAAKLKIGLTAFREWRAAGILPEPPVKINGWHLWRPDTQPAFVEPLRPFTLNSKRLKVERCGARMSALKATIVDAVAAAGDDGITVDGLRVVIYGSQKRMSRASAVRNHLFQINRLMAPHGWRLAPSAGKRPRWRLRRATP